MSNYRTRRERETIAARHAAEMTEKYRQHGPELLDLLWAAPSIFDERYMRYQLNDGLDWRLWFGPFTNGKRLRDYPLPYCRRFFFTYFLSRIFVSDIRPKSSGLFPPLVADAQDFLDQVFPAIDSTDKLYIEELLLQAQEVGLFTEGTVVYATGRGTFGRCGSEHVKKAEKNPAEYEFIINSQIVLSASCVFAGGMQQEARAEFVRKWVASQMDQPVRPLAPAGQVTSGGELASLTPSDTDLRKDIDLDYLLCSPLRTKNAEYTLDELAGLVGFTAPGKGSFQKFGQYSARVRAIVDAVLGSSPDQSWLAGGRAAMNDFAVKIGQRYGHPVKKLPDRPKENDTYWSYLGIVKAKIKEWNI